MSKKTKIKTPRFLRAAGKGGKTTNAMIPAECAVREILVFNEGYTEHEPYIGERARDFLIGVTE